MSILVVSDFSPLQTNLQCLSLGIHPSSIRYAMLGSHHKHGAKDLKYICLISTSSYLCQAEQMKTEVFSRSLPLPTPPATRRQG